MLRYISLLLFIGLVWAQDITIAVLDFDGKGVSQSDAGNLTDRLRDELFKTGAYVVLERGQMEEVLKEQGLQQAGICETECAVEVGRLLGVQQMVAGSIGKVGTIYTVSARVFDVTTGKILKSANYDNIGDISQLLLKGTVFSGEVRPNDNSRPFFEKVIQLTENNKNNIYRIFTEEWLGK